jgi:SAM-dependent methyltransferase
MVTLPPEQGRSVPGESHQAREMAESFGNDAERYERTRPAYPQAMVDAIIAASPGNRVLDVGIGTGISARPFHRRGCRVLGVEPDERMAQLARRNGFEVEVAAFELWDPTDRAFDLVISGQAWHWVDPVAGAAKAAGVLIPGGRIALFWNAGVFPPELGQGFAAVYRQVLPDFPFFQNGMPGGAAAYAPLTNKAARGIRQACRFSEPEQWKFGWSRSFTAAQWLDTVPTFGGHSQIRPDKLAELLDGLRKVIEAAGGSFTMGYDALVATATRTDIH